ncbi:MAG: hypothetical protein RIA72_06275 [Sphingopyxis sp.]|uniref:hypothetical protein n=1 Tax=Sphingopyxis sp. TaxID=1908224 RepID=UPI0032ED590F
MKKKIIFSTLGAALVVTPALAAPGGGDRNAPQTRAEVQAKAAEMFARMDVNKDGKLDAADRAAARAERQARMFERLDANKDGNISKAEWDQHGADRAAKRAERGDKRADAGEGKRGMRGHHGKRGGHRAMMMGKADTNGDKAISLAEFQTAALARFDAADANKDGQVTPEERQAKRGEWRAKRGAAAPAAAPATE